MKHSNFLVSQAVTDALAAKTTAGKIDAALKLDVQDKLAFFQGVRVKHPRLDKVLPALMANTRPYSGADITLLLGPTGVGKTTIAGSFYDSVLREYAQQMLDELGIIPIIKLEAPATGEVAFSHRIFYLKMLQQLQSARLRQVHASGEIERARLLDGHGSKTVAGLRLEVEAAFAGRRCGIAVIDETFHLVGGAGKRLFAQMNGLKSLSNETGVKFVLVGSYDLLPILDTNAQLSRRCSVVHISRYRENDKKDCSAFAKILSDLGRMMPLENQPSLIGYHAELMRACVGLPGVLKETLQRALNHALADGGWSESCLDRALITRKASAAILADCLTGEKCLDGSESGMSSLQDFQDPPEMDAA